MAALGGHRGSGSGVRHDDCGSNVGRNRRWYNLNSLAADYLQERKNERLLKLAAADYGVDAKSGM